MAACKFLAEGRSTLPAVMLRHVCYTVDRSGRPSRKTQIRTGQHLASLISTKLFDKKLMIEEVEAQAVDEVGGTGCCLLSIVGGCSSVVLGRTSVRSADPQKFAAMRRSLLIDIHTHMSVARVSVPLAGPIADPLSTLQLYSDLPPAPPRPDSATKDPSSQLSPQPNPPSSTVQHLIHLFWVYSRLSRHISRRDSWPPR